MEANSEATNTIRSWKRKQKIPKVRKRKRTRKLKTSRGAGSGSIKNLTASTSLRRSWFSVRFHVIFSESLSEDQKKRSKARFEVILGRRNRFSVRLNVVFSSAY